MPFLVVASITLEILVDGATQPAGDEIGEAKRSFSGVLRSSIQAEKERYNFTVGPITESAHQTLRTAANRKIVACSGDAIVSGNYLVRLGPADYVKDSSETNDFRRTVQLTLDRA